jgi:two-component system KDP operon response regulator KdpE
MEPTVTILLVEDEALLRQAFRTLLEANGYEVCEAGTAAEALAQAAARRPDLVLLDLGLPDRDGTEVLRELRAREGGAGIAIVALTGRVGPDVARACALARCADLLIKPVLPRELLRRIPTWLERPATDAPAGSPA